MHIILWVVGLLALGIAFIVAQAIYLAMVLKWEDEQTVGLKYYGRPAAGRARFKRTLRRHARLLSPILRLNSHSGHLDFRKARIVYEGLSGPSGSCSTESFARGASYAPQPQDVFVATQMKCGTTWMQHVVYEVLHRGQGSLVETGTALYAVSPWLEGRKSVSLEEAPLLGRERPARIIKTHFPAQFCPFSREARYIYVARHPVSCFASCIDFVVTNVGTYAPPLESFEQWFTSPELMWWGTWTDHVKGWWQRAQHEPNVLFLYFEDMKRDLPGVIRRVAEFLNMPPLDDAEVAQIARKCGFSYMQEHQDNFEMHPPHILQTSAELFVSGHADRHKDVPPAARERVLDWAAREIAGTDLSLLQPYEDVLRAAQSSQNLAVGSRPDA
ncbi:MAG TPA: sulfotransferase domain-containing protein [Longimicrobiales bacterium]